ncbi:hypothetical protein GJAV_G00085370 [Gymnothorax javanicus]|nr:hypothetical protein GJAV_G00085370 [Gymnothorax javanicus]
MDEQRCREKVSAERTEKQKQLRTTRSKFQQRIQESERELQDLRQAVQSLKRSAQAAVEDSERIFTELIRSIERRRSEVKELIRDQEKAEVSRVEGLLEQLEQEIAELRRRDAELEQLSHTEDHIHFLQSCQSFCALLGSGDLPSISVSSHDSFEAVRKSFSELKERLEDVFKLELVKISESVKEVHTVEPRTREDFLQYSCQLTLDPKSAHGNLRLSEWNRRVTRMEEKQRYPDHPERFDGWFQRHIVKFLKAGSITASLLQNITTTQLKRVTPVHPFPRHPRAWPLGASWGESPGRERHAPGVSGRGGAVAACPSATGGGRMERGPLRRVGCHRGPGGPWKAAAPRWITTRVATLWPAIGTGFAAGRSWEGALSPGPRLDPGRGRAGPEPAPSDYFWLPPSPAAPRSSGGLGLLPGRSQGTSPAPQAKPAPARALEAPRWAGVKALSVRGQCVSSLRYYAFLLFSFRDPLSLVSPVNSCPTLSGALGRSPGNDRGAGQAPQNSLGRKLKVAAKSNQTGRFRARPRPRLGSSQGPGEKAPSQLRPAANPVPIAGHRAEIRIIIRRGTAAFRGPPWASAAPQPPLRGLIPSSPAPPRRAAAPRPPGLAFCSQVTPPKRPPGARLGGGRERGEPVSPSSAEWS